MALKFTEVTRVSKKYSKKGVCIETCVTKDVTDTSANRLRRRKAEAIAKIQKKVDDLEIPPWFANSLVKMIKNVKPRKNQKVVKERQYIEVARAERLFKHSLATDINKISLLIEMYNNPSEWCIEEEHKKALKEKMIDACYRFALENPKIALLYDGIVKLGLRSQLNKRIWYERYMQKYVADMHEPLPKLSKEELDAMLENKIAEAKAEYREKAGMSEK